MPLHSVSTTFSIRTAGCSASEKRTASKSFRWGRRCSGSQTKRARICMASTIRGWAWGTGTARVIWRRQRSLPTIFAPGPARQACRRWLLDPDLRLAHEVAPALGLAAHLRRELGGRGRHVDRHHLVREPGLFAREDGADRGVELVHHRLGCGGGREEALPGVGADAGVALLGERRHVR